MKYQFIETHADRYGAKCLCEVIGVSRSGYYDWLGRETSARDLTNQALLTRIKRLFDEHRGRYGSPPNNWGQSRMALT